MSKKCTPCGKIMCTTMQEFIQRKLEENDLEYWIYTINGKEWLAVKNKGYETIRKKYGKRKRFESHILSEFRGY